MADSEIGSRNEAAIKRKERLLALQKQAADSKDESKNKKVLPTPTFRSYKPQDENLKKSVLDEAKPGNVQILVQDQLNLASNTAVDEELNINSLQPKKPDWDLKREISEKLEKLERRTQKAIAELIRDRLKQNQDNLAAVVNVEVSRITND